MAVILVAVVTLVESIFLWLAIGAYEASLTPEFVGAGLPLVTRFTVIPGLPFPWQGSPWIVVIWTSMLWTWRLGRQPDRGTEALVIQLAVLLGALLTVGAGMLASAITIGHVLR